MPLWEVGYWADWQVLGQAAVIRQSHMESSKSLLHNILQVSSLNPKIWQDFPAKTLISIDRQLKKISQQSS